MMPNNKSKAKTPAQRMLSLLLLALRFICCNVRGTQQQRRRRMWSRQAAGFTQLSTLLCLSSKHWLLVSHSVVLSELKYHQLRHFWRFVCFVFFLIHQSCCLTCCQTEALTSFESQAFLFNLFFFFRINEVFSPYPYFFPLWICTGNKSTWFTEL